MKIKIASPEFNRSDRSFLYRKIENILSSKLSMGKNVHEFENHPGCQRKSVWTLAVLLVRFSF